jgi:tetratricopeptide (TPR) repeat protein
MKRLVLLVLFTIVLCRPVWAVNSPAFLPEGGINEDVAWRAYNESGLKAYHQGYYNKAEALFEAAVKYAEKTKDQDMDREVALATSLTNLAGVYQVKGNFIEAESLYERALAIRQRELEEEHPDIAISLYNLGSVHYDQNEYADAELFYRQALQMGEKTLSPEDPRIARILHGMAILYWTKDNYAQAESLFKRALSIYERSRQPLQPQIAAVLNDLANFYSELRNYSDAEPLYKRALSIREEYLDSDNPAIAQTLESYAAMLRKAGKRAKARRMEVRARKIWINHSRWNRMLY